MRAAALALAVLVAGCATAPAPVPLTIVAINDFHGNLKPPSSGLRLRDPADPAKTVDMPAGGIEHLASAVAAIRRDSTNSVFVAAGDLVGATPLLSALFHDEPTVEALGLAGLEVSAVGNHEFDHGAAELLRLARGGCHPTDGCRGPRPFAGARFQYLAASTVDRAGGRTLLPPYVVKRYGGIPVAFIGLTLRETPQVVVPSGVAGLDFGDEAQTVNALVPELRAQGIEAIVVLIHEGGFPSGDIDECPGISGPIVDIVKRFDRAVDIVVSGHTHRAYNCRIDGRLVTSADKYGTVVTRIETFLDPATRDFAAAHARNVVVDPRRFAADARLTALVADYERLARPLAERDAGSIAAPLGRDGDAAGISPLGRVVADAQLAATRGAGAQIALMNEGGIRAALGRRDDGRVRYEDLFAVQPFSNNLVTLTLSGAQVARLLEQQWSDQPKPRHLQPSRGFAYAWQQSRPVGQRIVPGSITLDGRPLDMGADYRVTVNSFMAAGGDNLTALKEGRDARTGVMDIDALEAWLRANPGLVAPEDARVRRID